MDEEKEEENKIILLHYFLIFLSPQFQFLLYHRGATYAVRASLQTQRLKGKMKMKRKTKWKVRNERRDEKKRLKERFRDNKSWKNDKTSTLPPIAFSFLLSSPLHFFSLLLFFSSLLSLLFFSCLLSLLFSPILFSSSLLFTSLFFSSLQDSPSGVPVRMTSPEFRVKPCDKDSINEKKKNTNIDGKRVNERQRKWEKERQRKWEKERLILVLKEEWETEKERCRERNKERERERERGWGVCSMMG